MEQEADKTKGNGNSFGTRAKIEDQLTFWKGQEWEPTFVGDYKPAAKVGSGLSGR